MNEPKKPDFNIVKKVFDRSGPKSEKVSPLFTHFKGKGKPAAPIATAKPAKPLKAVKVVEKKTNLKKLPVAIDFGLSRIKLVQLAQDSKGSLEVIAMDEELLTEDSSRATQAKSKQALEKLLSRNPVGPQAILGLPAKETQTFNFAFPAMSDEELREAVKWKIKQLRPFELDEDKVKYAIFRWDSTPLAAQPGTQGQQRVTVVCVSGVNVSQKAALLTEVGLKPISIQVCPLSLMQARRYGNVPKVPDEVVLWLDLGAEESVLIVEKNGVVFFLRNLPVTGRLLNKQIAQACKVDEAQAEELKNTHGLSFWTPEFLSMAVTDDEKAKNPSAAVCAALVSTLENLVLDIEHSFKHFSYQITQSQISKFDRVILTGGSSNLGKLDQFLSDRLSVPVNRLDPFTSLKIQDQLKAQRKNLAQDSLRFTSALGLALSHVGEPLKLSNFMGADRKIRKPNALIQKLKSQPQYVGVLALVILGLAAIPQISSLTYYRATADITAQKVKSAKSELKRRQSSQLDLAEREKQLLEKKASLEEKLSLFKQSHREKKNFSNILVKLASLLPDEIWATKLSYAEKKLIVVGATSKNEYVVDFLEELKKPNEFSDVAFNYTKRDGKSSIFSFEVVMGVK